MVKNGENRIVRQTQGGRDGEKEGGKSKNCLIGVTASTL